MKRVARCESAGRRKGARQRRALRLLLGGVLWALAGFVAVPGLAAAVTICANPAAPHAERLAIAPGRVLTVDLAEDAYATLLEEQGSDLLYRLDGEEATRGIDIRPPRLGIVAIPGSVRQIQIELRPGHGPSAVRIHRRCADTAQLGFLALLDQIYRDSITQGPAGGERALQNLDRQLQSSRDSWRSAWLSHARAQALLTAGQFDRGRLAFERAREQWLAIGDRRRAAAALLGVADLAHGAGNLADAVSLSRAAAKECDAESLAYFALRARSIECNVMGDRGRKRESLECSESVTDGLRELGEWNEVAVRDVSSANTWIGLGDLDRARRRLDSSLEQLAVLSPVVRGRLHAAWGNWWIATGDPGTAAIHYRQAAAELAGGGTVADQADVDFKLARIARLAGAADEERRLLEQLLGRLESTDARSAKAQVELRLGQLALDAGDLARAATHQQSAAASCSALDDYDCTVQAGLAAVEIALAGGEPNASTLLAQVPATTGAWRKARKRLLEAQLELQAGDAEAALELLQQGAPSRDVELRLKDLLLRAEAKTATQQLSAARDELVRGLAEIESVVLQLPSVALMASARTHLATLQAAYFDLLPASQVQLDTRELEQLLRVIASGVLPTPQGPSPEPDRRRREQLSRAVLDRAVIDGREQFIEWIDTPNSAPSTPRGHATTQIPRMGERQLILLPLAGRKQFRLVTISDAGARICLTMPRAELEQRSRQFDQVLAGTGEAVGSLGAEAARWHQVIRDCEAGGEEAERWWVTVLPGTPQLPWAWIAAEGGEPAQAAPIVSLSFGLPDLSPHRLAAPARLVLADFNLQGQERLPFVDAEIDRLQRSVAAVQIPVHVERDQGRSGPDWLKELGMPSQWTHVMGHGNSPADGPLYAGLWLPTAAQPELMIWPDIAATPNRAELVVLSACGSGPRDRDSRGVQLVLAEAFLAAGSRHVVAASNALSDAAAPFWTGHFYDALVSGADPGLALRDTQQRMRSSPHFRHPRFWAGLAHYIRRAPASTAPP